MSKKYMRKWNEKQNEKREDRVMEGQGEKERGTGEKT